MELVLVLALAKELVLVWQLVLGWLKELMVEEEQKHEVQLCLVFHRLVHEYHNTFQGLCQCL